MATKKELTTVAKELNKVLGLDPAIDTGSRVKLADLEEAIKQAIELIEPGDEFTEATQAIITALSPAPQEEAPEDEDEEEEEEKPAKAKKEKTSKTTKEKTELGHSVDSQAGKIDVILLKHRGKAVTLTQMSEEIGCTKSRIKAHVKHLETKGFKIAINTEKDTVILD